MAAKARWPERAKVDPTEFHGRPVRDPCTVHRTAARLTPAGGHRTELFTYAE